MKAGRKSIPKHLKIIAGTLEKSRENPNAPQIAAHKPTRPSWVSKGGKKFWNAVMRDLERLQVVTPAHGMISAIYCDTLALYLEQRDILEKEGQRYATKNQGGNIIVRGHPILTSMNETKRLLLSMLSEFGLTPASTSRVSVFPGFPHTPEMHEKPKENPQDIENRFFN